MKSLVPYPCSMYAAARSSVVKVSEHVRHLRIRRITPGRGGRVALATHPCAMARGTAHPFTIGQRVGWRPSAAEGGKGTSAGKLSDLQPDVGEATDLAANLPEKVKEHQAEWDAGDKANVPPLWGGGKAD